MLDFYIYAKVHILLKLVSYKLTLLCPKDFLLLSK